MVSGHIQPSAHFSGVLISSLSLAATTKNALGRLERINKRRRRGATPSHFCHQRDLVWRALDSRGGSDWVGWEDARLVVRCDGAVVAEARSLKRDLELSLAV